VKQSNGKDIAVLLMDSQGVSDESPVERNAILSITSLLSSVLVINAFDINEDLLLDPVLEYGLKALESKKLISNSGKVFQNLVFFTKY